MDIVIQNRSSPHTCCMRKACFLTVTGLPTKKNEPRHGDRCLPGLQSPCRRCKLGIAIEKKENMSRNSSERRTEKESSNPTHQQAGSSRPNRGKNGFRSAPNPVGALPPSPENEPGTAEQVDTGRTETTEVGMKRQLGEMQQGNDRSTTASCSTFGNSDVEW